MALHEVIEAKAEALAVPYLQEFGLTLVDVEYVKEAGSWYLRYYIDKEGGVGILDCETLSRALSDALDRENFIEDAYTLEVSSPGLGRPLKKEKDYTRNLNRPIEVRFYQMVEGLKEVTGTLTAFTKDTITLQTDDREMAVERKNISRINEYVDWNA